MGPVGPVCALLVCPTEQLLKDNSKNLLVVDSNGQKRGSDWVARGMVPIGSVTGVEGGLADNNGSIPRGTGVLR